MDEQSTTVTTTRRMLAIAPGFHNKYAVMVGPIRMSLDYSIFAHGSNWMQMDWSMLLGRRNRVYTCLL